MPRPTTETRREQIVDALLKQIAHAGYAGATIQSIAATAGINPGLIHYHFKDKRGILVAAVATLTAYAQARYERRAEAAKTPGARLRAYIDARLAYGDDARTDAVAAWVMIGAEAVRDADVRAVYGQAVDAELRQVRALLRARLAHAGKRTRGAARLAAALLAYVEGVFSLASAARDLVPKGFAADMAQELIERYVAAEPDAR
ncbi:TetR/AcrR family transcriptional regulator [Tahibacter soli]|uniref:TetR/AcrR family transcriptional regulator n=1 Tax=Tahibacter soli TaxID=2983605 RepID=A0A9X3YHJ0_9GAMM|nr:TetR/AcrR family transcriptional regulator [Tahibacter soli]MDC8012519.1 TetR/AcrR family transcriptional regulator [Tahibacter soli]